MKRFIFFLFFATLIIPASRAETLPINNQLYTGPSTLENSQIGYVSIEGGTNIFRSVLTGRRIENEKVVAIGTCKSLQDENCAKANYVDYLSILGPCEDQTSTDCISGLDAIEESGKTLQGNMEKTFFSTKDGSFSGDISKKLPSGGQSSLVDIPGAIHDYGTKYLPIVRMKGASTPDGTAFELYEIYIRLYAVKIVQGNYKFNSDQIDLNPANYAGTPRISHNFSDDLNCVLNDLTHCVVPTELPLDKKFRISIRTSIPIPGWMHGKVENPEILIRPTGKSFETTITAKPIVNPVISVQKDAALLSAQFLSPYANGSTPNTTNCDRTVIPYDFSKCSYVTLVGGYNQQDFDEFLKWLPYSADTAFINPTIWNFISDNQTKIVGNCPIEENKLGGIVSTNASMYLSGPPTWSPESQTLDYKVAAPHLLSNKRIFQGSYDLAISSKLARCIYKFSDAPIGATISITSTDGTPQVATSLVKEVNGYLYLSAKGFTYSSPNLSVKLSGEKISEKIELKSKSVQKAAPVTKITCIKGKMIKAQIAKNCPKGWKLKISK